MIRLERINVDIEVGLQLRPMPIIYPSENKGERGRSSEMHCIQMTCFYYIFILPRKQLICDFESIKNAADFKVAVVASRFFGIDIIVLIRS